MLKNHSEYHNFIGETDEDVCGTKEKNFCLFMCQSASSVSSRWDVQQMCDDDTMQCDDLSLSHFKTSHKSV